MKRHKLPLPHDESIYYSWEDLGVGMNFNVYKRIFRIVDCDDFTKRFYADQGKSVGTPEAFPEDMFKHTRAMVNYK
jgi:hypothetical protein